MKARKEIYQERMKAKEEKMEAKVIKKKDKP